MAIVSAPILQQAGFVAGVSPPTPEPSTRLAPELNGVDQWIQTPEILINGDGEVGFKIQILSFGAYRGIAYGEVSGFMRQYASDGALQLNNIAGRYDTFNIPPSTASETIYLKIKRELSNLTVTATHGNGDVDMLVDAACNNDPISFTNFGRNSGGRSNVRIYDIYANDKSQHDYPCDDGFDNNPTIRNRGSAGNAVIASATLATWTEINL